MSETSEDEKTIRQCREEAAKAEAARNFPDNTCPASRHVALMADALAEGKLYAMWQEEPRHCAASLYSVLASLWSARTELATQKGDDDGRPLDVS